MARREDDFVSITPEPISQQKILEFVTNSSSGGISIFIGTTRDNFQGKTVVRLEYEAYTSMAMKQLHQLCHDIRNKWAVHKIAIVHRTGLVLVCEASVVIAVSSEHRKQAIEAVSYAIDEIKRYATIWKKEVYSDNREQWKENRECAWLQTNS